MASDIKKEDDLEQFWSFLNGENDANNIKQKNINFQPLKEDLNSKSFDDDDKERKSFTNKDMFSEKANNLDKTPHKISEAEFDLSKALKVIEDIEAFGKADDLSEVGNLSSLSDSEYEDIDSKDNNNYDQARFHPSEKIEEGQDAYGSKKYGNRTEEGKKSDAAEEWLNSLSSTVQYGGLAVAVVLSLRLLFMALSTVKDFLHYVAVCF